MVPTFFFFSYGIGQVINGIFCKKYNIKWMIFCSLIISAIIRGAKKEKATEENVIKEEKKLTQGIIQQKRGEKKVFYTSIYVLCFCAIGVNLIKDGLTTWVPSILKEEYSMADSLSILLTILLPIVAIFGNAYALTMHKKIPDYVTHCFVVFAMMGGVIGIIIGSLGEKRLLFIS